MKPALFKTEANRAYELVLKAFQSNDKLCDHLAPRDLDEYREWVRRYMAETHLTLVRLEQRLSAMRK